MIGAIHTGPRGGGRSDTVPVYAVERRLPGATLETVERIETAAHQTAQAFAVEGSPIRYLGSTFIPGESRCQSRFEAPNADLVQELNDAAQIPYSRIVIALEFSGEAEVEGKRHLHGRGT